MNPAPASAKVREFAEKLFQQDPCFHNPSKVVQKIHENKALLGTDETVLQHIPSVGMVNAWLRDWLYGQYGSSTMDEIQIQKIRDQVTRWVFHIICAV